MAASVHDPIHDLLVNVGGTIRVATAARDAGTSRFVFVSSGGAIYGESRTPATERVRPRPLSPYGIHKLAGEGHVAVSGLSYAIARPSNVYGPGQVAGPEGAVIAAFAASARAGRPLRVDGDGRQTRDFVHVADVVNALMLLASTPDFRDLERRIGGEHVDRCPGRRRRTGCRDVEATRPRTASAR